MKKISILAAALLIMVGCGKKQEATTGGSGEGERIEVVELTTLHPREIQREITVSSNLQGYETVNIAPTLTVMTILL